MTYVFFLLCLSVKLFCHSNTMPTGFGFFEGFKHPIMGFDHLLAMCCVGLISSKIGKRAIWYVPLTFIIVMSVGCVVGFYTGSIPYTESMIALSVAFFGALLLRNTPILWTLLLVSFFAGFHGVAHGKEMPIFVLPDVYIMGFVSSSALIHLVGVFFGEAITQSRYAKRVLRYLGTLLIFIGMGLLFF